CKITLENGTVTTTIYTLSLHDALPILKEKGYKIINQSIFDLENYPTIGNEFFRQYPNMPFYVSTFYGKVRKDIYWNFRALKEERSEEHTSELQSRENLVCRLLLEKKNE